MTATISPEYLAARNAFEQWYDALDSDKRELVDSIAERTYYITEPEEYLSFIDMLDDEFSITTAMDFEDKFEAEFEGYGDRQLADFTETLVTECYEMHGVPNFVLNHVDWQGVWNHELRYDYTELQFNENTYLFRNH